MKNIISIEARCFHVTVQSMTGGSCTQDRIVISKTQLRAAQLVGQSSKELITRMFAKNGLAVLDIGKPERRTLSVDLEALWGGQ